MKKTQDLMKDYREKNNVDVQCPHCGLTGNKPTMKRWHFSNCRSNPAYVSKTPTIDRIISAKERAEFQLIRKFSDKSNDPDYCDFIPGTESWHSVMVSRGYEPQASISKALLSSK